MTSIEDLLGKTLTSVEVDKDLNIIRFTTSEGRKCRMYHSQDCCEDVSIDDITGDVNDLIGEPLLVAEELTNQKDIDNGLHHETWTFYKLATVKGYVDIKWWGVSNGYYSESVDFEEIE